MICKHNNNNYNTNERKYVHKYKIKRLGIYWMPTTTHLSNINAIALLFNIAAGREVKSWFSVKSSQKSMSYVDTDETKRHSK